MISFLCLNDSMSFVDRNSLKIDFLCNEKKTRCNDCMKIEQFKSLTYEYYWTLGNFFLTFFEFGQNKYKLQVVIYNK